MINKCYHLFRLQSSEHFLTAALSVPERRNTIRLLYKAGALGSIMHWSTRISCLPVALAIWINCLR